MYKFCFILVLIVAWLDRMGCGQSKVDDPGVRAGPAGVGGAATGLTPRERAVFDATLDVFRNIHSVQGNEPNARNKGLGPRFNGRGCAECHAQPAVGGSSPSVNPQIAAATDFGANNLVPDFISLNGPVKEVRFISNRDGTPDGGVHNLFTITGRRDATNIAGSDGIIRTCRLAQPDFANESRNKNLAFRIPTPVFGLGDVEVLTDDSLRDDAISPTAANLGIVTGVFNRDGATGNIGRFGWKAQISSLLAFAGEANNVEQGVTNEFFPQEREEDPNCQFNSLPEDHTRLKEPAKLKGLSEIDFSSDTVDFAIFMRLSEPPAPVPFSASAQRGQQAFTEIGCSVCHVQRHITGLSVLGGQSHRLIQPFSDFALHHMGAKLADGIAQGSAGPDQFRTAPLWGIGKRLFFLHDGRTRDLLQAILDHADFAPEATITTTTELTIHGSSFVISITDAPVGSEANQVIQNFMQLSGTSQQDILNFLRSL